MDQESIIDYISRHFTGVSVVRPKLGEGPQIAVGDTFFIYDPARDLAPQRQFPFATLVTKDYGDFDCASNLSRDGVFRFNIGVSKETYRSLFGSSSKPDAAEGAAATGHDFTALDQLMPHPVYAAQSWVCVLNPSPTSFAALQPLLADAYDQAVRRYERQASR